MPAPAEPYRILVVDDDRSFLAMVASTLPSHRGDVQVATARSGKECLRQVERFAPHLILLDIGMDGMNGPVTCRFIRSVDSAVRIVFLSGHDESYIRDAAGMVQADGYFTKTSFIDMLGEHDALERFLESARRPR